MPRWMSIDHGDKRVGVAVGHTEDRIATPARTLSADPEPSLFQDIAALANEYDVQGLVVGWPLNMSGDPGSAMGCGSSPRTVETRTDPRSVFPGRYSASCATCMDRSASAIRARLTPAARWSWPLRS